MAAIRQWLEQHDLGKYADVFAENDVGLDILPDLDDQQLEQLGVSLGDRVRMRKAIASLSGESPPATRPDAPAATGEAERRQLTVMFCDLVGSVELAEQLDVEDYRDLLARFRNASVAAVERYQGFVARHQGDGMLVYFGYPQAHEDDAERALRAGLAVVDAVDGLEHPYTAEPKVRVGIATGPTVVGDVLSTGASERSELAALGPTPNLAARLQGEAEPNTVVISETTRTLTAGHFELEALPARKLKGISDPVTPYRVRSEVRGQSRFAARSGSHFSRFVGREEELELLTRRWSRAKGSRGQVMLIVGEAGIGKSRLVQQLRERIGAEPHEPHEPIHVQCSPYHESSALFPVIATFERALGFSLLSESDARLERLQRHLAEVGWNDEEACGLMAHLLSLPVEERFPAIESMDGKLRRERTLQLLIEYLNKRAAHVPVLCIFEDLHWIDPSTLELFERLVEAVKAGRVLLLATTRPGIDAPWSDLPHVGVLSLSRLGQEEGEQLAQAVAPDLKAIPSEVIQGILSRAGGIPLYIEELTQTVLQSSEAGFSEETIPATLQDSLMARLDASIDGKAVAQCAAVFGRTFEHDLLTAVWMDSPERLANGLDALGKAALIYRQGESEGARYVFKHALVRDAAYGSLLREHRASLHQRVADALEEHSPGTRDSRPALLAHHYTRAGDRERALEYWQRAGRAAARNNAPAEAEASFRSGLELLREESSSMENLTREIELLLDLGATQMWLYGYSTKQVAETYTRARDVATRVGNPTQGFEATWGLWLNRHLGGNPEGARDLLEEIGRYAAASGQTGSQLQAHHAAWTTLLYLGKLDSSFTHTEKGMEIYSVEEHGDHAHRYGGHDPAVCSGAHAGVVGWMLGHIDQAHSRWRDAVELAERLDHRSSRGIAIFFGALMFQYRREPEMVLELVEDEASMAGHQRGAATVMRGWAVAALGEPREGLRECERGLEAYRQTGANIRWGYVNYLAAEAYAQDGRTADAIELLGNALDHARTAGDHSWYPELIRARAAVRIAASHGNRLGFVEELEMALDYTRVQHSKSLELRVAMTLSQLLRDNSQFEKARNVLEPVYAWFTEGFDTPDLKQAKALLDELQ
jgi:class 3 adenylate cyclase/predicted ATPase